MFFIHIRPVKINSTEFILLEYISMSNWFSARDTRRQSTLLNEYCSRETSAFLHGCLEFD